MIFFFLFFFRSSSGAVEEESFFIKPFSSSLSLALRNCFVCNSSSLLRKKVSSHSVTVAIFIFILVILHTFISLLYGKTVYYCSVVQNRNSSKSFFHFAFQLFKLLQYSLLFFSQAQVSSVHIFFVSREKNKHVFSLFQTLMFTYLIFCGKPFCAKYVDQVTLCVVEKHSSS